MNGRTSKAVRKKSIEFVVEWLKTMLIEEEAQKISVKNYQNYMPNETHIFANNKFLVSSYTPRWFAKLIKRKLKFKSIDKIQYSDII
jgi:hypothetical protein